VRTGLGKNSGRNNTGERNERNTFDKTARTGVGKNSGRKNTGERNERNTFWTVSR
jgi:hypothetical protein